MYAGNSTLSLKDTDLIDLLAHCHHKHAYQEQEKGISVRTGWGKPLLIRRPIKCRKGQCR